MCGIAGLIGQRPVNPAAVQAMTDIQTHRGPDDSGLWVGEDGCIALGHRRLSILDTTEKAHQPMVDEAYGLTLVFNGEIYNYKELAARLKAEGVRLSSSGDTEVLLAAYRVWGEDCLAAFNGMFAFALFDAKRGRLFCARDRFGEKPFIFSIKDDFFAFASEYKALFTLENMDISWDPSRLARFLENPATGLDDGRETIFAGISQLLPGESLSLDLKTLTPTIRRYWGVPVERSPLPHGEAVARFGALLADSVRLRLRSDVPLGSCLSGGLDSGAIVCLARKELGEGADYNVFTGRFPGTSADEWDRARLVVEATGAVSHVTEPTAEGFLDNLADFAWSNELPVGSSSQYAQWCVFKLAKEKGVTVLLDGQGADEILGGYEQYFAAYLADVGVEEEAAIRARYPAALAIRDQSWKKSIPLRRTIARLSGRGSDVLFGIRPEAAGLEDFSRDGFGALHNALYKDSFHTHLPTLLRYGDRNSMAHSREVRLPFCDHRIADFVFSLEPQSLMGAVQTKRLLREAMIGILPEGVRSRWNKQGFRPPQEQWFRGPLLAHAEALIHDPSFGAEGFWMPGWWKQVLKRLKKGEDHLAWILWAPVTAEAWRREFVERARKQPKVPVFKNP